MTYRVTFRCEDGHEQTLDYHGVSRQYVETFAGLMDGTSPFYVSDPREDGVTQIGRCAWPIPILGEENEIIGHDQPCGKKFTCTVSNIL
jgi:hypothetical protein